MPVFRIASLAGDLTGIDNLSELIKVGQPVTIAYADQPGLSGFGTMPHYQANFRREDTKAHFSFLQNRGGRRPRFNI